MAPSLRHFAPFIGAKYNAFCPIGVDDAKKGRGWVEMRIPTDSGANHSIVESHGGHCGLPTTLRAAQDFV